jgi:hypothetical protein
MMHVHQKTQAQRMGGWRTSLGQIYIVRNSRESASWWEIINLNMTWNVRNGRKINGDIELLQIIIKISL